MPLVSCRVVVLSLAWSAASTAFAFDDDKDVCEETRTGMPECLKKTRKAAEQALGDTHYIPLHERTALPGPKPILSEGCGKPLQMPAGTVSKITLPVDDPNLFDPYREAYVYLPKGYNNSLPLPAVYAFHGYYSSAELLMQDDHFLWKIENDLAAKGQQGFIVIHGQGMADCGNPQCYAEPYPSRSWNVWGLTESPGPMGATCDSNRYRFGRYGCSSSCRQRAGDVTDPTSKACHGEDHCFAATCANETLYVDQLMQTIESRICIDKRRQYVTGMSVGAMMAYYVAVHFADRFAAAIPVAGSVLMGFWQAPRMEMPLMDIHGTLDDTIPANYSNGFVPHGPHSTGKPMEVPGCADCAFSNDGFYYTSNYNITRGVAEKNKCSCTGDGADCSVKHWPTMYDGDAVGDRANWTCFESFGTCGKHPVVRCTWAGNHNLPLHGKEGNNTVKEKHQFFSNIAWEFFSKHHINGGSEKEALLLVRSRASSTPVSSLV